MLEYSLQLMFNYELVFVLTGSHLFSRAKKNQAILEELFRRYRCIGKCLEFLIIRGRTYAFW